MKICSKCGIEKDSSSFSKGRAKCKSCTVETSRVYQRTLRGLVNKIYQNQIASSSTRGLPPPSYTRDELYNWMIDKGLMGLWQNWVDAEYDKWLSPSIDRIDNSLGYSLKNIQLITWKDNLDRQKAQNRSGELLHTHSKAVVQYTKDGNYLKMYPSAAIAAREMTGHNRNISNITNVCSGKNKSAYGYKWKFYASH